MIDLTKNGSISVELQKKIPSCFSGNVIIGVDEAGRGPLLGPVAVSAVVLDSEKPIVGLTDSKKLSEKKREALYQEILENALAYSVVFIPPAKIDEVNILQATFLGMRESVFALNCEAEQVNRVLIDGNKTVELPFVCEAVVGGDAIHAEISAASILAKVCRDNYMYKLHEKYPNYAINRHKGYPTKLHKQMLEAYGVLPEHRRSFKPISQMV